MGMGMGMGVRGCAATSAMAEQTPDRSAHSAGAMFLSTVVSAPLTTWGAVGSVTAFLAAAGAVRTAVRTAVWTAVRAV